MPQPTHQPGKRARERRRMLWSVAGALLGHALALAVMLPLLTHDAPRPAPADPLDLARMADVLMPTAPDEQLVVNAVDEPVEPPPPDTTRIAERDANPVRETVKRPEARGTRAVPAIDEATSDSVAAPADPGPAAAAAVTPRPIAELPQVADPVRALPVPPMPESGSTRSPEPGSGIASAPKPDTPAPALVASVGTPAPRPGTPGTDQPSQLPLEAPIGDETALAAHASEKAAYLNGVRRKIQDAWRAREIYKQAVKDGLAERGVESLVMLRLRADGTVERTNMLRGSGVASMDTEALAVCGRAAPFDRPPAVMMDDRGGVQFPVRLTVTENLNGFQQQARRTIRERWRPSPAFSRAGDKERFTVAKILLTAQGVLARAQLVSSAGIDFLDQGAMTALASGLRLPGPPDDYNAVAGLVPLLVEFRHTVRRPGRPSPPPDVRVLNPREQPQYR
jgi:outer membrane biosynthesis protein TonB